MNLFSILKVFLFTARSLNVKSKHAATLARLPMEQLVPEWASRFSQSGVYKTALRTKISGSVAGTALRLGFQFPEELRAFYEVCDGVETSDEAHPYPFFKASELRFAGSCSPSLSEQAERQWREWGEGDGDPRAFQVYPSGYLAAVMDQTEGEMQFPFADSLLAMYPPQGGRCLCMAIADAGGYAPGTVFEIENLTATRYHSLSAWLAASASRK
jgi:hypothetical protein